MSVTAKEVIQFFKTADLELAELVLEFGTREVEDRVAKREAISANLKKARAARKPKVDAITGTPTGEVAPPEAQVPQQAAVAEQPRRGPGRPHSQVHVAAPAHTAEATAATAD